MKKQNRKFFSKILKLGALLVLPVFFVLSCKNESPNDAPLSSLAQRGKGVYLANCIACHNPNPQISGSIGPDVAFSSIELLEARVLKRVYPPGYKPKRKSDQMPDFPQLQANIPALHAYLNSFKK